MTEIIGGRNKTGSFPAIASYTAVRNPPLNPFCSVQRGVPCRKNNDQTHSPSTQSRLPCV